MAEELFAGCVASEMTLGKAVVRGILPTVFARHVTDKSGKYLVFCSGQAHMKRVPSLAKEWFGQIDPEMHVYSTYSADSETSWAYKAFVKDDSDPLKLLFFINMLNEDVHVQDVSDVILFRQTESPIIYKQQIGRALATDTQCTPLILDVVNNFSGLSSYGMIQSEMDETVERLRREDRDGEIVVEKLAVIEQVRDAAELFRQLENSLSMTWDAYYAAAESYYAQHDDLLIPSQYVSEDGLCLGLWLHRQRRTKAQLSQGQIVRLERIGVKEGSMRMLRGEKDMSTRSCFIRRTGICCRRVRISAQTATHWVHGFIGCGSKRTEQSTQAG